MTAQTHAHVAGMLSTYDFSADDEASRILKAIRRSAPSHAKLILAEFVVPEDGKPNWTLFVDLLMLGYLTGKEWTRTEFGDLLAGADFKLDRVIDTRSNIYLWKHL